MKNKSSLVSWISILFSYWATKISVTELNWYKQWSILLNAYFWVLPSTPLCCLSYSCICTRFWGANSSWCISFAVMTNSCSLEEEASYWWQGSWKGARQWSQPWLLEFLLHPAREEHHCDLSSQRMLLMGTLLGAGPPLCYLVLAFVSL